VGESLKIIRDKALEKKFTETISIADLNLERIEKLMNEKNVE
jgi:hypothetical protein